MRIKSAFQTIWKRIERFWNSNDDCDQCMQCIDVCIQYINLVMFDSSLHPESPSTSIPQDWTHFTVEPFCFHPWLKKSFPFGLAPCELATGCSVHRISRIGGFLFCLCGHYSTVKLMEHARAGSIIPDRKEESQAESSECMLQGPFGFH